MLVSNYTAAAAICMVVTCLTARNLDNFNHEDGVQGICAVERHGDSSRCHVLEG